MTTFTTNVGLGCPALDDLNWDGPIRSTIALLDSLSPLASGAVRPREIPSSSLNLSIAPATIRQANGQVATYAGGTLVVTASTTTFIWLTDAAALASGTAWPLGPYVPLAVAVAGTTSVASVADARVGLGSVGAASRLSITTASAAYAIPLAVGLLKLDATSGAFTATLPTAVGNAGLVVRAIKIDASANAVTIATTGGQAINGASTLALSSQWAAKAIVSDGSNWVVI